MTDTDRKLQLTRFLREENAMNRTKMRSREEILYGTGRPFGGKSAGAETPLVYSGHLRDGLEGDGFGTELQPSAGRVGFGLRLALAVILFAAVVYIDQNEISFMGKPVAETIISQVGVSDERQLLDFCDKIKGYMK